MSDNITSPVPLGAVLATDEINGVHHPLTKVEFGGPDEARPVTSSDPLPVTSAELTQSLQELSFVLRALSHSLGILSPDNAGRLRVTLSEVGVSLTGGSTSLAGGGMSAVGLVPFQTGTTFVSAAYDQYGQMMQGPMAIRDRINVT